jgi:3-methylcrotonyl-CoA carboxylase alpha subunit
MPKRLQLTTGDEQWTAEVAGDRVSLQPGDGTLVVTSDNGRFRVEGGGDVRHGQAIVTGDIVWVTILGEVFSFQVTHGTRRGHSATRDHDAFTPPMSATVVRLLVKAGDAVKDGDVLIALEAMKMEMPIRAPRDGVVAAVRCREGDMVQPGDVLLEFE